MRACMPLPQHGGTGGHAAAAAARLHIAGEAEIARLEQPPYEQAVPFRSTAHLLAYAAGRYGPSTALYYQQDPEPGRQALSWSFTQYLRHSLQAAHVLRGLGVRRGDPVALLAPNVPTAQFALWGAQMAGCAFPINYLLQPGHIAQLLRATGTRVVVTLGPSAELPLRDTARRAAELAGCVEHVLEIDPDEHQPAPGSFQEKLRHQPDTDVFLSELDADGEAALFHTGGTTGLPKILRHTHRNEVHTSWFGAMYYDMNPGDLILNGFPLFHVAGVFVYGLAPLAAGAALFLPTLTGLRNQAFMRHAWEHAHRYGMTHLGCVPTVLSALLGVPREPGQADSVRWALTGGSPLPNELAARFEAECGIPIRNIFGMTECAGIVSIEPCGAARRPGSTGMRLPYSQVRAIPLEAATDARLTRFCAPGETGVVAIRGPHVSTGYLDAAQNAGTFTEDGWLISGDLGHVDETGYIHLTGRSRDLIIRSGHNIDPGQIEEAFLKLPAVSTCAAVGEPDGYAGELPVVFVTLKEGTQIDAEQLLRDVAAYIPERPAQPKQVYILDKMPMTPVGKIYKPTLRAQAAQEKIFALLAQLGLPDTVQVQCAAESRGIVATLAGTQALSRAQRQALEQALGSMPLHIEYGQGPDAPVAAA